MAKRAAQKVSSELKEFKSENVLIKFRPYENGNTVGFCTLVLYDAITISQCTVIQKKDGTFFVATPSYKGKDGNYYNYVYLAKDDDLTAEIDKLINESMELPFK